MISSKQLEGKSVKLKNFMFGVLDSTNADIDQKFGLQKRMKFHSSYLYILCSIMLATRNETSWSSSCNTLADTLETFSVNIRLFAKVARNCWSHMPTYKWEWCPGFSIYMIIEAYIIFCICLMTNKLVDMNTLSLALQKQTAWLIDRNYLVKITIEILTGLSSAILPIDTSQTLSPKKSYYAYFNDQKNIVADF